MLHHRWGVDNNVARQCLQTAVAFMRSRSLLRKVGIRPRSSLGKRFIRMKEFLRYLAFVQIPEAFSMTSSIYAKEGSEKSQLNVVVFQTCLSDGTVEQLVISQRIMSVRNDSKRSDCT